MTVILIRENEEMLRTIAALKSDAALYQQRLHDAEQLRRVLAVEVADLRGQLGLQATHDSLEKDAEPTQWQLESATRREQALVAGESGGAVSSAPSTALRCDGQLGAAREEVVEAVRLPLLVNRSIRRLLERLSPPVNGRLADLKEAVRVDVAALEAKVVKCQPRELATPGELAEVMLPVRECLYSCLQLMIAMLKAYIEVR